MLGGGAGALAQLLGQDGDDLPGAGGVGTRFNVGLRAQGNACVTPRGEDGVCSFIFENQCRRILNRIQR